MFVCTSMIYVLVFTMFLSVLQFRGAVFFLVAVVTLLLFDRDEKFAQVHDGKTIFLSQCAR